MTRPDGDGTCRHNIGGGFSFVKVWQITMMNSMQRIKQFFTKRIFLDYASATPVLLEVRWAMSRYMSWDFYNPNAIYTEGVKVREKVEEYRTQIARRLGVAKEGIIFTSGGTESNTWAIRGVGEGRVILDSESHPSTIEATKGMKVSTLQVDTPLVLKKDVVLVSSVTTDNKLGRQVREWRKKKTSEFPLVHIDATQSAGYFDVSMEGLSADLITLDGAKLYGPKGIGILAVRRGVKLDLPPQGTPPVALIAGFAKALEIAVRDREAERVRLTSLSDMFVHAVSTAFPDITITQTLPNIVNVSVPNVLPEFLVLSLDKAGLMVSAGPACNAHKPEPPETPVRISLGRQTSEKDIQEAIKIFCLTVQNMLK